MPPFNAPSWTALIGTLTDACRFSPPAAGAALTVAEQALAIAFPDQLRELLLECDGIVGEYGDDVVWPAAEIVRQNREFRGYEDFRELYMPFDHLLFFGADGGGDQFAYAIHADGNIAKRDVFRWDHETDGREWYAGHLEQYLERQLTRADDAD
jgi:hypothetical protein